jgi:peroxiredoxin
MMTQQNSRFQELEQKFSQLEAELEDTPEKEAISILHAMIHESRRQAGANGSVKHNGSGMTLEHVANLYKSAPGMQGQAENEGLPVGTPAPDFTLLDGNGKAVSLSDFRGQNVVLAFYPLDWSPACSDQLSLYQSELSEFEMYNAQVIGISVDSLYSHGAWAAVRGLTFPLLADFQPKGEVARRYKVMRDSDGFSERALYVIDSEGLIRYCHISPELHKIPDIYELFDQLKALRTQPEASLAL